MGGFFCFPLHAHISTVPFYLCHRRNLTHAFSPLSKGNCCYLLHGGLQGSVSCFSHTSLTVLGLVLLDFGGGVFQQFCPFAKGPRSLLRISTASWTKFIFAPSHSGRQLLFLLWRQKQMYLCLGLVSPCKVYAFASREGGGYVGGGFHYFVPPTGSLSGLLPSPESCL